MNFVLEDLNAVYIPALFLLALCCMVYAGKLLIRCHQASASLGMAMMGLLFGFYSWLPLRMYSPAMTASLDLTVFHIAGFLILCSFARHYFPNYLTKRRIALHIAFFLICVVFYWYEIFYEMLDTDALVIEGFSIPYEGYLCLLIYALYIAWVIGTHSYDPVSHERREVPRHQKELAQTIAAVMVFATIVVFCFDSNLAVYTALLIGVYLLVYYIYRKLNKISTETAEKIPFGRALAYHAIAMTVVIGAYNIALGFTSENTDTADTDEEKYPHLNLTKNPLWDKPPLGDDSFTELGTMMQNYSDPRIWNTVQVLFQDTVSSATYKKLGEQLDTMPADRYKGFARILLRTRQLYSMDNENVTEKDIYDFLTKIYAVAEDDAPVPQRAFLQCWEHAIDGYVRLHATDSVKKEAEKMLAICRKQNIPRGIISAYIEMGYSLEYVYDFQGAITQYTTALDYMDRYFEQLYGKNWKKDSDESVTTMKDDYNETFLQLAKCYIEIGDTAWVHRNLKELKDIQARFNIENVSSVSFVLYYILSIYYDTCGDRAEYDKTMKEYVGYLNARKVFESKEYTYYYYKYFYYVALVRHFLRTHETQKAMQYINKMKKDFCDSTTMYYPEALYQEGNYKKAAETYRATSNYYYHLINGNSRLLLNTMSTGLGEEDKRMQIMQAKIREQQTRLMYNTIVIILFALMLAGLAFFLWKQSRLNKELSKAVQVAERASHVKDIFLKNMTHEFHTPLNAIYGFSQILADESMPVDEALTRELAGEMVKSSEHITKLLDNIVTVTDKLSKLDKLEDVESCLKVTEETNEKQ